MFHSFVVISEMPRSSTCVFKTGSRKSCKRMKKFGVLNVTCCPGLVDARQIIVFGIDNLHLNWSFFNHLKRVLGLTTVKFLYQDIPAECSDTLDQVQTGWNFFSNFQKQVGDFFWSPRWPNLRIVFFAKILIQLTLQWVTLFWCSICAWLLILLTSLCLTFWYRKHLRVDRPLFSWRKVDFKFGVCLEFHMFHMIMSQGVLTFFLPRYPPSFHCPRSREWSLLVLTYR